MYKHYKEILRFPDYLALCDDKGKKITYQDIAGYVQKIEKELKPRSVVCVVCDNTIETAAFIFAVILAQRVLLPMGESTDVEKLESICEKYKPHYVWCKNSFVNWTEEYSLEDGDHLLYKLKSIPYEINPDLATLLTTSGSTGSAKMVKEGYSTIASNMLSTLKYMKMYKEEENGIIPPHKVITPLSMSHILGLRAAMNIWYNYGTVMISDKPVMSQEWIDFVVREQVDHYVLVPFSAKLLDKVEFWEMKEIQNLSSIYLTAGRTEPALKQKLIHLFGDRVVDGYGQTELSQPISFLSVNNSEYKCGSAGMIADGMKAWLNEDNELVIESGSVSLGYSYGYEDLGKEDENRGILYTGDIAEFDENHYLYLKGRKSRFVKILGERISLDEIEVKLNGEGRGEFACLGVNDSISVFAQGEKDEDVERVCESILSKKYRIPKKMIRYAYIDMFPRLESNKIDYMKLKEMDKEKFN